MEVPPALDGSKKVTAEQYQLAAPIAASATTIRSPANTPLRIAVGCFPFTWFCAIESAIIQTSVGVWRSWLARSIRVAEVGGSSPLTPTSFDGDNCV